MKSFIAACVAAIIIAIGAVYILDGYQRSAESAYSSSTGVRLDS